MADEEPARDSAGRDGLVEEGIPWSSPLWFGMTGKEPVGEEEFQYSTSQTVLTGGFPFPSDKPWHNLCHPQFKKDRERFT